MIPTHKDPPDNLNKTYHKSSLCKSGQEQIVRVFGFQSQKLGKKFDMSGVKPSGIMH